MQSERLGVGVKPAMLARLLACRNAESGMFPCAALELGRDPPIPTMARKSDSLRYFLKGEVKFL